MSKMSPGNFVALKNSMKIVDITELVFFFKPKPRSVSTSFFYDMYQSKSKNLKCCYSKTIL